MKRALVTGGAGFLGSEIVRQLLERGVQVTAVSRRRYPELVAAGAASEQLDLASASVAETARLVEGHDTVFHTAALAGVWGPREAFQRTNVTGTATLLAAAQTAGVERFVHTSSPSVVFGTTDHVNAGADLPYPDRFESPYPESKAAAERLVLAPNLDLPTVALRPHLIFGPGDPHLLPRVVARARAGRLVQIGDGQNLVSLTFVENAAAAHLAAADRLTPDAACRGGAYFVNQREPARLWDWIGQILDRLEIPRPRRSISPALAYRLGQAAELAWKALRRPGEPPMTRFVARQLALSHTYDLGPAERDLGYVERVDLASATERTIESLR